MGLSSTDRVSCPKCRQIFAIINLVEREGGRLSVDACQRNWCCPECKDKVLVCDTNGKGNLVAQQGVVVVPAIMQEEVPPEGNASLPETCPNCGAVLLQHYHTNQLVCPMCFG